MTDYEHDEKDHKNEGGSSENYVKKMQHLSYKLLYVYVLIYIFGNNEFDQRGILPRISINFLGSFSAACNQTRIDKFTCCMTLKQFNS